MITATQAIVPLFVRRAGVRGIAVEDERTEAVGPAPVPPSERRHDRSSPLGPRLSAPFLAQLIATRQSAPQTRARNRAEPREATAAYGQVAAVLIPEPR